jgi:hypothetical protein
MLARWQVHQSAKWRDGTVQISGAPAEAMA